MALTVDDSPLFHAWLTALEARHLADLRISEVTRALRALSAAYVGRREAGVRGALDSRGKRAAFALFYAPLHYLTTSMIVRALDAHAPAPRSIVDIGCGTGAAGAAWAVAAGGAPVEGIDRHPWAVAEATWTYRQLGLAGRARAGDAARFKVPPPRTGIVAAYVLNELPENERHRLVDRLVHSAGRGSCALIIEPIATRIAPWWPAMESRITSAGGRADEWRFTVDLPAQLALLDKAAGLDHRELTARSFYCPGTVSG